MARQRANHVRRGGGERSSRVQQREQNLDPIVLTNRFARLFEPLLHQTREPGAAPSRAERDS